MNSSLTSVGIRFRDDRVLFLWCHCDQLDATFLAGHNPIEPALSGRECEVLQSVAEGYTSGQIAARLCISERTVATHRRNLAEKLGIHGVAGLTKYAIRHGLTTVDRDPCGAR